MAGFNTERRQIIDTYLPTDGSIDPSAMNRILSSTNLATELTEEQRDDLARLVVEEYDIDERSRSDWADRVEKGVQLASMLVHRRKNYPWPNAADIRYPLLTQAVVSFGARLYPSLINGVKPVKARVVGSDPSGEKANSAVRVEQHMSYQVLEQMEEWEEETDRLIIVTSIVGNGFKKTYYDNTLGRNVSEFVHPLDLCVNYWAKSLETANRVTHLLELSKNDIYERVMDGRFLDVKNLSAPDATKGSRLRRIDDENNGRIRPNETNVDEVPRFVIEQHRLLDLDGDGYAEPYIVTVDYQDRKLYRLVARYDYEDILFNQDKEVVAIRPVNYFTKFSFLPSPDGSFYDVGFYALLGSLNEAVNTIINQLVDAGTLSNMQSGFLARGIRIKDGKARFAPGEWKSINSTGDDLRKGIFPLPVREPSQVLYTLLGLMIESGQKLGQTVDILTGENPGQNQKATTTLAVIEQGLKVFNAIYKRFHRSLKKEFKMLHRLNGIYLDPEEYFTVIGGDATGVTPAQIFRLDYSTYRTTVIPYSDPNVSSEQQRLAKAQVLIELNANGLGLNPEEVKKRVLEAMDIPGIDALLNVPEQPPSLDQLTFELEKTKFKHQAELDADKQELERMKVESSAMQAETAAVLNLAKAGVETLQQRLNEVEMLLNVLRETNGGASATQSTQGEAASSS